MIKKWMSFLLVCIFVLSALPVYAAEAGLQLYVSADRKVAMVGDTVCYRVMATGEDVIALQFDVSVPDGMRYVSGSGATPKGLRAELGVAAAGWTEQTMRFSFYNDQAVQIPEGTVLLSFECEITAEGSYQVSLTGVAPYDSQFEGFEATVQSDMVGIGEVSEGGETQVDPVPPELETQVPDGEPETVPGTETVPGDSAGTSSGNAGSIGSAGGNSGEPYEGNANTSSGSSAEGNSGTAADSGSAEAPSGNSGSSAGEDVDVPSGGGNASFGGDSSVSSSDGSASSGDGSGTSLEVPNSQTQSPDAEVSTPGSELREPESEEENPGSMEPPSQDTVISAEDTPAQHPEIDIPATDGDLEIGPTGEAPSLGDIESDLDSEGAPAEEETIPSNRQNTDSLVEDGLPVWVWPTVAAGAVLAVAAVIFLVMKKKRQ